MYSILHRVTSVSLLLFLCISVFGSYFSFVLFCCSFFCGVEASFMTCLLGWAEDVIYQGVLVGVRKNVISLISSSRIF